MPRVPQYDAKVQTTALPGVRRSSSATTFESEGGQIGQAQAAFGATLARVGVAGYGEIVARETKRKDDIANLKTLEGFNKLDQQFLYDPETGFLNKKGIEPHEQAGKYLSEYEVAAAGLAKDLTTETQQRYYEQLRINRADAFHTRVSTHGATEYDKYEASQFQATMTSSLNAAIAAGVDDLATVRTQLQAQELAIATHGARLGMSPIAQEVFRDELRAKVHTGIIQNLLADPDKAAVAKTYFEETRDAIAKGDPEAVARIEKAVTEGALLAQAQKEADRILATFSRSEDARAAAKALDPKLRGPALEMIEHEFAYREHQADEAHKKLTLDGLNIAERTGRTTGIPGWSEFTVGERGAIKNYLEDKARGVPAKTDSNVWATAVAGLHSADPEERKRWQNMNPLLVRGAMSDSDWQEFIRNQEASKKGDDAVLVNAAAQTAMVNEALGGMGLDPTPIAPGQDKHDPVMYGRVAAFRAAVRSAVQRHEAQTGKPAPDSEVQEIVDALRTKISGQRVTTVPGKGLKGATYGDAYAFEVGQAQATSIADIPPSEVRRLKQILRDTGGDWSDAGVLKFFNADVLPRIRKDR